MLEYKARRQNITIIADLENHLPEIIGFPGELNQVWTNIIDNAIDAMKDGGELTVKTYSTPGLVFFTATDTGPGIPPENLERIFDPFFTTKDVGEGTGVGLDLVQKVVQQHRGKITVNSRPGHTEFKVSFPQNLAIA
jgi:signal transduction histidine kinase